MLSVISYGIIFPSVNSKDICFQYRGLRKQHSSTIFCLSQTYQELSISQSVSKPSLIEESVDKDSFTVSYLVHSCGLSESAAILASEKVKFETRKKPDTVITIFKNHGFSKTQISKLVRKRPQLLSCKPDITLLPKLEFLQSIGVSRTDLGIIVSRDPTFFTRSLENQIIPSYNYLKTVLLSDEKIASAAMRTLWIFLVKHSKILAPNIELLREMKVPESKIILLLAHYPEALIRKHGHFREAMIEVMEMGFDPLKSNFVLALHGLSGKGNKATWDHCHKTYTKWGWSNDDILSAFKTHPQSMLMSEKKICGVLDFLVNEMGWESSCIARYPNVLNYSLEKRIIPRCSLIQLLLLKGFLVKEDVKLTSVLIPSEKRFLERFVTKYEDEAPELLEVYNAKLEFS